MFGRIGKAVLYRKLSFVVVALGLVGFAVVQQVGFLAADAAQQPPAEKPPAAPAAKGQLLDPARVAGYTKCIDCHRTEVAAWQKSMHWTRAFDLLLSASAVDYAKEMSIPVQQITRRSMCLGCHATPAVDDRGHPRPLAGVSCESCHNPAGGETGWLNAHAVYGPPGTRREAETADHYAQRAKRSGKAGQIRSSDLYALSQRCLACHIVGNEKLVNTAGHKLSGDRFEMLKKMSGDVRHNFHLSRKENALVASLWTDKLRHPDRDAKTRMGLVYVVGQLVRAETVLRHLAAANKADGDYAEGLAALFESTLDNLEDTKVDALAALADDHRDLCDRLLDADFERGDKEIIKAAEKFGGLARQYSAGKGGDLKGLELPKIDDELQKAFKP